jgi:hypothetical protein
VPQAASQDGHHSECTLAVAVRGGGEVRVELDAGDVRDAHVFFTMVSRLE